MRRAILPALALAGCVPHNPRDVSDVLGPAPVVIGHRGAAADAPENTMAGFRRAADLGVAFELDVTATSDGVVIVLHDDTLDRTTTGSGFAHTQPWRDLRDLDAGSWFDPRFAGEPLPTLDAVFAEIGPGTVIDVEIKSPVDPERVEWLAGRVVDSIVRNGRQDSVFVTSFNPYVLGAVRALAPEIRRGQLLGTFRGADLSVVEKVALKNLLLNKEAQADLLAVEGDFVTAGWLRRMQRRGYRVICWTINDAAEIRRLVDLGVDGIITDRPAEALEVLRPGAR